MFFYYWLVAVMPLQEHWLWGRELWGTFTLIKALGVVCLLVALYEVGFGGASPQLFRSTQSRWYVAFVAFQCASYFLHWGQVLGGWQGYSNVVSIATLFFTVLALVDNRPRLFRTLLVAVGAVAFVSLHAIRQQQKFGDLTTFRPGGLVGDANEYSLLVGLWMPVAFLWAFSKRPLWERVACFCCLIASLLGTTFAASRGGFLGFVAGFLYLTFRSRHRLRNFAIVGSLVVPLVLISPSSPWRRFREPTYGDQMAQQARLIAWKAGWRMIKANPLTGVGLFNFKPLVLTYEDPGESVQTLAHNTYLGIAAELGIPALVVFIGLLVSTFRSLEKVRRRAQRAGFAHLPTIALGLQAGLVSYSFAAFFLTAFWQKMLWLLIFLSICVSRLDGERTASRLGAERTGRLTDLASAPIA